MKLRFFLCLLAATLPIHAEVSLPKLFSSHMVLQRDMPIHVWGSASPGEAITVSFHDLSNTTTTDATGRWSLYLPPQPAGGPYTLTVRGTNSLQLDDILLGDLWFASGQSNMEMPLAGFGADTQIENADKEIAAADLPDVRLLLVGRDPPTIPSKTSRPPPAGPAAPPRPPKTSLLSPTSLPATCKRPFRTGSSTSPSASSTPPGVALPPKPGPAWTP